MERSRGGRPRHPDILTPAEQRVLDELRAGGTNAEIAVRLGVSPDAVKYHISNMLGKLELGDRHQLAAWRPDTARSRLRGLLAAPAGLSVLARPLVWAGVGGVVLAGIAAVVAAVLLLPRGDGGPEVSPAGTDCDVVARADGPAGAPAPGGTVAGGATVVCGEVVTLTAQAKDGYCFSHWDSESPSEGCPLTSTKELTASGGTSVHVANFKVPPLPEVTAIPYNLATSSAAELTTPGSYTFLEDADDISSEGGSVFQVPGTYGLLVHESDADGASRAAFYATVSVGDRFDLWANDQCFFRYEVTEVLAAQGETRAFKVSWLINKVARCGRHEYLKADTTIPVTFRWGVSPGVEGEDGIRVMIFGEPAPGPGRYRIEGFPVVIFIPAGMTLTRAGGGVPHGGLHGQAFALEDVESGSVILLYASDGTEAKRTVVAPADDETAVGGTDDSSTTPRDVNALFDALVASVEVVD